jgi:L-alanine-DL-glutamate epimerase-like enolase superfamily enzyme
MISTTYKALTNRDINRIVTKMEAVRTELGPVIDFAIENHWKYDTSDAITLLNALEHLQPMWVEDPPSSGEYRCHGEAGPRHTNAYLHRRNLYGVHGFRKLIESQACAGVHIDIPKSGGLLESKRISDFADMWEIWPWWQDLVKEIDKPIINRDYIAVPGTPGLGVTLNDDVMRQHALGVGYFEPTPMWDTKQSFDDQLFS